MLFRYSKVTSIETEGATTITGEQFEKIVDEFEAKRKRKAGAPGGPFSRERRRRERSTASLLQEFRPLLKITAGIV
jgi:hypothetical protein